MQLLSRVVLVASLIGTATLIVYVHDLQEKERVRLHEGVLRDQERQRYKAMLTDGDSINNKNKFATSNSS